MARLNINTPRNRPRNETTSRSPTSSSTPGIVARSFALAALTILKAHSLAGYPTTSWAPLGSFERWDKVCLGGRLVCHGSDRNVTATQGRHLLARTPRKAGPARSLERPPRRGGRTGGVTRPSRHASRRSVRATSRPSTPSSPRRSRQFGRRGGRHVTKHWHHAPRDEGPEHRRPDFPGSRKKSNIRSAGRSPKRPLISTQIPQTQTQTPRSMVAHGANGCIV